jgi:hypothetical protein
MFRSGFSCAPSPGLFHSSVAVIVDLWKRNLFRVILECSTMTIDDGLDEQRIRISKGLIELVREEREKLLRQIEDSQNSVTRSREIIKQLDAVLAEAEKELTNR